MSDFIDLIRGPHRAQVFEFKQTNKTNTEHLPLQELGFKITHLAA